MYCLTLLLINKLGEGRPAGALPAAAGRGPRSAPCRAPPAPATSGPSRQSPPHWDAVPDPDWGPELQTPKVSLHIRWTPLTVARAPDLLARRWRTNGASPTPSAPSTCTQLYVYQLYVYNYTRHGHLAHCGQAYKSGHASLPNRPARQ